MYANEDPYKTLGIEPDATIEEIKHAYHNAAKKWHPDVSKADPAESERQFRLVTDAYKLALRNALLAGRKTRKARQACAGSDELAHQEPQPDRRYYTPPVPHPRGDKAKSHQPRRRSRLKREFHYMWRDARTGLLAGLCLLLLIPLVCILAPTVIHWVGLLNMDPDAAARYEMRQAEIAEEQARREGESYFEETDPEAEQRRRDEQTRETLVALGYFLSIFVLPLLAWLVFRFMLRLEKT